MNSKSKCLTMTKYIKKKKCDITCISTDTNKKINSSKKKFDLIDKFNLYQLKYAHSILKKKTIYLWNINICLSMTTFAITMNSSKYDEPQKI